MVCCVVAEGDDETHFLLPATKKKTRSSTTTTAVDSCCCLSPTPDRSIRCYYNYDTLHHIESGSTCSPLYQLVCPLVRLVFLLGLGSVTAPIHTSTIVRFEEEGVINPAPAVAVAVDP